MQPSLDRLAARAAQFESFLAHQLARYTAAHDLSDDALAKLLRIPVRRLASLRLCGRIRTEEPGARARDVRAVAEKFGCDIEALAKAIAF